MAIQKVWIGSRGPFYFDDTEGYPDEPSVTQKALRAETIIEVANIETTNLTTNVRLVLSDANKQVQEVNDLTNWIAGGVGIVSDNDGDGSVTIRIDHDEHVITSAESPYSVTSEYLLFVDATTADVNINLPPLANALDVEHVIKRKDATAANNVIINTDGAETIEGSNSITLANRYEYVVLYPDPNEWLIIGQS